MKNTNKDFSQVLAALPDELKSAYYERLAYELTMVGRTIWSDPNLFAEQKLNCFRWLNEIVHLVINKIMSKRHGRGSDTDLIAAIADCIENSPEIAAGVGTALSTSYDRLNARQ